MFHPLSCPLQTGIRFFHHPLPTVASKDLAIFLVCRAGQTPHWAYQVPYLQQSWLGSTIPPVTARQRIRTKQADNLSRAILARARYCKLLWLFQT